MELQASDFCGGMVVRLGSGKGCGGMVVRLGSGEGCGLGTGNLRFRKKELI
jgi:hypothetical protein